MIDGYCGKYLFDDTLQLEYDGVSQFNGTTMEKRPSREFFYPERGWFRVRIDFIFKHYWNNSVVTGMIK